MNTKVWGIPLILALIIIFGLLAALLGTGIWYILSWIAMLIPLAIIVKKVWRKPATRSKG